MDLSEFIHAAAPLRALGVVVSQNGQQLGRHLWDGACRRNIYSATKSFTSAAVGIAVREGLLSLDEKLTDVFSGELPAVVSENLKKATVRDLLTMQLGQPESFLMADDRPTYQEKDWVRLALAQPFTYAPGTHFVYSNVGPYLAGILVQRRAGCDLTHYLMPRLFEPLGIGFPTWELDPFERSFGAAGLFLTIDELHRFGLLLLNHGTLNGKQLIPEEWVRLALSRQADIEGSAYGYGYLFWEGPHGSFRADGRYGQFSIVIPEKEAVITMTAECRSSERLLNAAFDHIYPQL